MENEKSISNIDTASQASIINQEITISIDTIHQNKKILVNFITFYLTAVFALFYYGAYIDSKINIPEVKKTIPNNDYLILGIIGVIITLIIFLFGWALLGLVTRTICTTIKQYKHISYMRNLSATFFPPNVFAANCLNPIASAKNPKLPIRVAKSLPYLFALVNFLFLFSSLYFFKTFLTAGAAISIFLIIVGIFSLFYPNIFSEHFTELKIAQEINPDVNAIEVTDKYDRIRKRTKKLNKYKIPYLLLFFLSILYFPSFVINLVLSIKHSCIHDYILVTQSIAVTVMAFLSLIVSFLKIEMKINNKQKQPTT